eukprot:9267904-Pyramimonas_sp.AAC.1
MFTVNIHARGSTSVVPSLNTRFVSAQKTHCSLCTNTRSFSSANAFFSRQSKHVHVSSNATVTPLWSRFAVGECGEVADDPILSKLCVRHPVFVLRENLRTLLGFLWFEVLGLGVSAGQSGAGAAPGVIAGRATAGERGRSVGVDTEFEPRCLRTEQTAKA